MEWLLLGFGAFLVFFGLGAVLGFAWGCIKLIPVAVAAWKDGERRAKEYWKIT